MEQETSAGAVTLDGAILIVEDDAAQAELIRMTLEQKGFRCEHAPTGADALEQLSKANPSLMLLDYSLPDMTGLDLVATLNNANIPLPPFIVITCTEDTRLAVSTMQHGARDYVVKDFEFLERLPSAVARATREVETEKRLREAERALRESEARLAKAQKIARMGSLEWDPASGKLVCSRGLARMLGIRSQQPSGFTLEDLPRYLHPEDLLAVREAVDLCRWSGKPFNLDCRVLREDGSEMAVNVQGEAEWEENGVVRLLSVALLDITERKRAENQIQRLAFYDPLTGLPNRTLLGDRLSQAIVQAHRDGRQVGVLFLDLDCFKSVNDTMGHQNGDRLLKTVARRLVEVVRESDTVARIGGDEFVIVLTAISHEEDIGDIAGKILAALSHPVTIEKTEIVSTGSIGISVFPMDGEDVHTLLKHADIAMYDAKDMGKNTYRFYSHKMNIKLVERLALETGMRRALERSEYSMHYQPQIELATGRVIGVEALIRWYHPEMGKVPTETFVPLAEETGLIWPIGEGVLRSACALNKEWQEYGVGKLRVAVNLSSRQFRQKNLLPLIATVLEESGLEPQYLELEVTEATIMASAEESERILRQLKGIGVTVTVDCFGTGFSSLSYLRRFALDRLKIDRSFISGLPGNRDDAAIVDAAIAMGRSLGLKVLAVGVETEEQLEFLRGRRCDEIQGHLASRPLTPQALAAFFRERGKWCHLPDLRRPVLGVSGRREATVTP